MIDSDMAQIKELLVGEFERETKNEFQAIYKTINELKEQTQQEIAKLDKILQKKYQYLETNINNQINSQKEFNINKFNSIQEEINIQQEFTTKAFNTLNSRFQKKLNSIKDDYTQKNISKESMATMFFEYALKLQNESIKDKLTENIK